jgi:hypothetical protein
VRDRNRASAAARVAMWPRYSRAFLLSFADEVINKDTCCCLHESGSESRTSSLMVLAGEVAWDRDACRGRNVVKVVRRIERVVGKIDKHRPQVGGERLMPPCIICAWSWEEFIGHGVRP